MRILYGVAGEGMGHAIRSKAVLEELQKYHNIKVVAGSRAYELLKKYFNTSRISSMNMVYINNSVSYILTLFYTLLKLPFALLYNLKLLAIATRFRPNIIITDLEPFTCILALLLGKKCISIDNQHITNTRTLKRNLFDRMIIRLLTIKADKYIVTTFFYPPLIKKNVHLVPPINRKEIITAKSKEKGNILVYQTSKSDKRLIPVLRSLPGRFIVYGLDKEKKTGNVTLKKFDEKEYLEDLTSCKSLITNGGFTAIGEALYLHKPILSIPVRKQFEQIRNALYLEKLGYGMYSRDTSRKEIKNFLNNLEAYRKNIKKYKKEDNSKTISILNRIINETQSYKHQETDTAEK